MDSKLYGRGVVFLVGLLFALYLLIPTFMNFNATREAVKSSGGTLPWYYRIFPDKQVKLGLDLQGGIHLVLGVDVDKAIQDNLRILATDLRDDLERQKYLVDETKVRKEEEQLHISFKGLDAEKFNKIRLHLRKRYVQILNVIPDSTGFGFTLEYKKEERKALSRNALEQALQVLRNRIDEFGVNEPNLSAQGKDRILIQLPGVKDPARAKELIGRTAQLSFMIVDDQSNVMQPIIQGKEKIPEGIQVDFEKVESKGGKTVDSPFLRGEDRAQIMKFLEGKVPDTHVVYLEESVNKETLNKIYRTYVLSAEVFLTGDMLDDARSEVDPQWNRPVVGMRFNPKGRDKFGKVTTDHVRERLAIVLDQNVMSAPRINEPILGGSAQISFGDFLDTTELSREANDLAIVLRAGSLKAPVEILEDRTIGPTLGADSIRSGKLALMVGALIVIVFMMVYYQFAGLVANIALVLNGLFILATLVMFQATMTLPGIAGLILTAGMAVDANVIIFERIREELRAGKDPHSALSSGYERAFWTVFDANITTALAGVVLMQYGTGPIKGFAVTLLIGIFFSFITAVYLTHFVFDWYLEKRETLAI